MHAAGGAIVNIPPNEKEARTQLAAALAGERASAAETLGHIDYKDYTVGFVEWLASLGDTKEAAGVLSDLLQTLSERQVRQRVRDEVQRRHDTYRSMEPAKKAAGHPQAA